MVIVCGCLLLFLTRFLTKPTLNSTYHNRDSSVVSPNRWPLWQTSSDGGGRELQDSSPIYILFWSGFYFKKPDDWPVKKGPMDCGQYKCVLTSDRNHYRRSKALIFHHRNPEWTSDVPKLRTGNWSIPEQVFVVYNRESNRWEPKGKAQLDKVNGLINWTMGLRRDDDVYIPTANIWRGQHDDGFDPNKNYMDGKTGFTAALLTSNCWQGEANRPYFGRRNFIEALKRVGLKFDTYGKCGKKCGDHETCAGYLKKYKFVLAFENSLCDDYLSEKPFANGLEIGSIPLIATLANITDPYILPPGSFIDALNFSSVPELVSHIKKVGDNPELYNKYFEWKANWTYKLVSENEGNVPYTDDFFCPLCKRLHELVKRPYTKVIGNYTQWYEQERCRPFPS